jgi:NADH:ubiquinone oxidoreductase subunit 5 (subunit L)/multisubunit Na+/H+ antiporter MnhA subunit
MNVATLTTLLGYVVIGAPVVLLAIIGLATMFDAKLSERAISRVTLFLVCTGLIASVSMLVVMLSTGSVHVPIELGNWVTIPAEHFHFHMKLVFDRLSVPFVILSFALVGVVGAFADKYMHREAGFRRFFVFYAMFLFGMVLTSLAGTIECLFAGWELVGLSSALLIAFFHDRQAPVRNGLRVWTIYRIADAAFLIAADLLHHLPKSGGDFDLLMGSGNWPHGHVEMPAATAFGIGLLLLIAAAGKSGQVPFSGWVPRAMEGPTPSSAVFYGALSIHLGAFLLLRVGPMLELSPWLCALVVLVGLATAVVGTLSGRVQTDIKSALAFASVTQVGVIVAEIGLGLRYIALCHIMGHACLRTLQLLRAPSILRDYQSMENAIGTRLGPRPSIVDLLVDGAGPARMYRFGLDRGYLDLFLNQYIAAPFLKVFRTCDAWERKWTDWLSGEESRESDQLVPAGQALEDLL